MENSAAFRILMICTGNICRSPAAELLLRARLPPELGVVVQSAGTRAQSGAHISAPMAVLLDEYGTQPNSFSARRLIPEFLREADLILTMTREQRSVAVSMLPHAMRRTFTLKEFASQLISMPDPGARGGADPHVRASRSVEWASAHRRPSTTRRRGSGDDIVDPYGRSNAVYRTSFAQIDDAIEILARSLIAP